MIRMMRLWLSNHYRMAKFLGEFAWKPTKNRKIFLALIVYCNKFKFTDFHSMLIHITFIMVGPRENCVMPGVWCLVHKNTTNNIILYSILLSGKRNKEKRSKEKNEAKQCFLVLFHFLLESRRLHHHYYSFLSIS